MDSKPNSFLSSSSAREATCPACGHHVAVPFLEASHQTLATIAWPDSAQTAQSMRRLPLDFVRCVECGHIYNVRFDYADVPYSDKPNLMFNRGKTWSNVLRGLLQEMLARLPSRPAVVEVGHGDGSFLTALAEARPEGRFVGFDPHGAVADVTTFEARAELFDPLVHLPELEPDLVISRHVLEHLTNPLGFLQRLSFAASALGTLLLAYFEVPCIDRVLETGRTVDFYYEHSSQFTSGSFTRMLSRCSATVEKIGHSYGGEVIYGFVRLGGRPAQIEIAKDSKNFQDRTSAAKRKIREQLEDLYRSGRQVAIWGGTGKSAAFINRYGLDAKRFPLVVDSDPDKVGTFVPGTGQEIRFRDWLKQNPVEVVIIPPQWRVHDIVQEMRSEGITTEKILIEHDGSLIDYLTDPHPYR